MPGRLRRAGRRARRTCNLGVQLGGRDDVARKAAAHKVGAEHLVLPDVRLERPGHVSAGQPPISSHLKLHERQTCRAAIQVAGPGIYPCQRPARPPPACVTAAAPAAMHACPHDAARAQGLPHRGARGLPPLRLGARQVVLGERVERRADVQRLVDRARVADRRHRVLGDVLLRVDHACAARAPRSGAARGPRPPSGLLMCGAARTPALCGREKTGGEPPLLLLRSSV